MFVLPDLPYDYSALTPFIDEETMHIHHDKHHATYVDNLNKLTGGEGKLEDLLSSSDQKIKNNAGGVANHNLFWKVMIENSKSQIPSSKSPLIQKIKEDFGSFDSFKEKFSAQALGHFGSGWAWLVVSNGKLKITDTANQDSPVTDHCSPVLCLDVWEHAYYLKYQNRRAEYIEAWWNIVNWREVEKIYDGIK